MSLREYRTKRNFRSTIEPSGTKADKKKGKRRLLFVVQKHAARQLHYDFRLEMEGVLKSWVVPKGLPTKHGERRLAVQVEDHPLDYAKFEGTIAAGNYGAGTVMVWDTGEYEVIGQDRLHAVKEGKLHLRLNGKKLKGEWTLVRMRGRANDDKPQWLMLKSGDDMRPISARAEDQSALTRRSLKQIAAAGGPQWESNRQTTLTARRPATKNTRTTAKPPSNVPQTQVKRLPSEKPRFVEPMKCRMVDGLPKGSEWIYEIKFDGVRALAIKTQDKVSLISRNKIDLTAKYPEVAEAVGKLNCKEAVLDGEVVAVDAQGRSSFQLLQTATLPGTPRPPILYYAFDLLNLNGRDTKEAPLEARKEGLQTLVKSAPETVLFSAGIKAEAGRVIKAMQARGLEGVVAKRRSSRYESGRRSGSWVKFKWTREQEFVIGGFTKPEGTRDFFGAILVGYYKRGKLLFASKVGTGFDQRLLKSLHQRFEQKAQRECPFKNLPQQRDAHGGGMTAAGMKSCRWLKPTLVCEVRFSEWTRDGHLRQPVFTGLREDKEAREVTREKAD